MTLYKITVDRDMHASFYIETDDIQAEIDSGATDVLTASDYDEVDEMVMHELVTSSGGEPVWVGGADGDWQDPS